MNVLSLSHFFPRQFIACISEIERAKSSFSIFTRRFTVIMLELSNQKSYMWHPHGASQEKVRIVKQTCSPCRICRKRQRFTLLMFPAHCLIFPFTLNVHVCAVAVFIIISASTHTQYREGYDFRYSEIIKK